jgi:hypothetical protein
VNTIDRESITDEAQLLDTTRHEASHVATPDVIQATTGKPLRRHEAVPMSDGSNITHQTKLSSLNAAVAAQTPSRGLVFQA